MSDPVNRRSKLVKKLLPAVVSFSLLGVGAYLLRDSIPELFSAVGRIGIGSFGVAVLWFLAATFAISIRLRLLFAAIEVRSGQWMFLYAILVATFASSFLHFSGGSALFIALLVAADSKASMQVCLVAGIADRMMGVFVAPLLATVGLLVLRMNALANGGALVGVGLSLAVVVVLLGAASFFPEGSRAREKLLRFFEKVHLGKLAEASVVLLRSRVMLAGAVVATVVVFFFYSLAAYSLAVPLKPGIPFWIFLALVPSLSIATSLPSVGGGLGVREAVFCLFLHPYLPLEEAVAVSFLFYGVTLVTTAAGGIVMAFRGWPDPLGGEKAGETGE